MASGARRTVDAAVALSPPDSADIWRLQDHGRYRPHDVLFISDRREAVSAEGMLEGGVRSDIAQSAARATASRCSRSAACARRYWPGSPSACAD